MEKIGVIVKVKGDQAVVRCSNVCTTDCAFCPLGHLFAPGGKGPLEFDAKNEAGAREGDPVRIELDAGSSLAAYGLAYGVPVIGLIIGALAGVALAHFIPHQENLIIGALAFLGAAAGFAYAVREGRSFKAMPVITVVLNPTEPKGEDDHDLS